MYLTNLIPLYLSSLPIHLPPASSPSSLPTVQVRRTLDPYLESGVAAIVPTVESVEHSVFGGADGLAFVYFEGIPSRLGHAKTKDRVTVKG